jgi:hypothetical protein
MKVTIVIGGVLLVFPSVWLGRKTLDQRATASRAVWTTTFVHFGLGFFLAVPMVRAVSTYRDWPGPALPIPPGIGLTVVIITGAACSLTVVNLAFERIRREPSGRFCCSHA